MATKILLATIQLGTQGPHYAGDLITDPGLQTQLAAIGAPMVLQSTNPLIDAMATLARKQRLGGRIKNAEQIMAGGIQAQLLAASQTGEVIHQSCTITQAADLAGLLAGVKTFDKNIGAILPANARLLALIAESVTDFDDATHGTFSLTVGSAAGGNQFGTALNVAAGQAGFPKTFAFGASALLLGNGIAGAQASARLTSSVDLNTATVGAATVSIFFTVLP